jgi:hypothetical protein
MGGRSTVHGGRRKATPVFTLFVLALPLVLVLAVVALTFGFVVSLLGFVITLPFRILGLVFRLLGFVIAVPLLPFLLLVLGVLWLFKRHGKSAVHA